MKLKSYFLSAAAAISLWLPSNSQAHFLGGKTVRQFTAAQLMDFLDQAKSLDKDETSCVDYGGKFDLQYLKRKFYVYANGENWMDQQFVGIDLEFLSKSTSTRLSKIESLIVAEQVRINKKDFIFTLNPAIENPDAKNITEQVMKFEISGNKIVKISHIALDRTLETLDLPSPQDIVMNPNYVYKAPRNVWKLNQFDESVVCQSR